MTPLLWASLNGHEDVAALLQDRGADKEAKDRVSGPRVGGGRGRMGRGQCGVTQVWIGDLPSIQVAVGRGMAWHRWGPGGALEGRGGAGWGLILPPQIFKLGKETKKERKMSLRHGLRKPPLQWTVTVNGSFPGPFDRIDLF